MMLRNFWAAGLALAGLIGAAPAAPAGEAVEVRNSEVTETVHTWLDGRPGGELKPIVILAARNGTFSGRLVVTSAAPIKGLKAEAGELVSKDGAKISKEAVLVRYALPADPKTSFVGLRGGAGRFDALVEAPPASVAVSGPGRPQGCVGVRADDKPSAGATAPVWITVRVGADAKPGEYEGKLKVQADGLAAREIPVRLKVHDWRLPDPKDFTVHHNFYQSHESVARYYDVPFWSDKHFDLMGRNLKLAHEVGGKLCLVHLLRNSHCQNNAQTMVRWIRKEGSGDRVQGSGATDGTAGAGKPAPGTPNPEPYTYDFAVFDKYLETYEKAAGKPGLVVINAWEWSCDKQAKPVTLLDPASGKVEDLEQPAYGTPESEAFWRPVLAGVRQRLEKKGWWDVTAIGSCSDRAPGPKSVAVFQKIWPDAKWFNSGHVNPSSLKSEGGAAVPLPYSEHVWAAGELYNPDKKNYGGKYPAVWKRGRSRLEWGFPREGVGIIFRWSDGHMLVAHRMVSEACLQGNLNGLGMVGLDFWPLPVANRNDRRPIFGANFGQYDPGASNLALVTAGPDGPVASERYEAFREGVEFAEAVIFLKNAVDSGRLGADLAKRGTELLDERARHYLKTREAKWEPVTGPWAAFESSGWKDRDDRLLALCAEAAKVVGGK